MRDDSSSSSSPARGVVGAPADVRPHLSAVEPLSASAGPSSGRRAAGGQTRPHGPSAGIFGATGTPPTPAQLANSNNNNSDDDSDNKDAAIALLTPTATAALPRPPEHRGCNSRDAEEPTLLRLQLQLPPLRERPTVSEVGRRADKTLPMSSGSGGGAPPPARIAHQPYFFPPGHPAAAGSCEAPLVSLVDDSPEGSVLLPTRGTPAPATIVVGGCCGFSGGGGGDNTSTNSATTAASGSGGSGSGTRHVFFLSGSAHGAHGALNAAAGGARILDADPPSFSSLPGTGFGGSLSGSGRFAAAASSAAGGDLWVGASKVSTMCRHHLQGKCNRGVSCRFSHGDEEGPKVIIKTNTRVRSPAATGGEQQRQQQQHHQQQLEHSRPSTRSSSFASGNRASPAPANTAPSSGSAGGGGGASTPPQVRIGSGSGSGSRNSGSSSSPVVAVPTMRVTVGDAAAASWSSSSTSIAAPAPLPHPASPAGSPRLVRMPAGCVPAPPPLPLHQHCARGTATTTAAAAAATTRPLLSPPNAMSVRVGSLPRPNWAGE